MKDRALLPEAGQFYKANLHCHTVLSDGRWTKEQVKAEYQKRGYSVVAFTDHRHYGWHPELMDETFIPLAAYEADLNEPFPPSGDFQRVRTYHLNFYDTHPETRTGFEAQQPPQRYGDLAALNEFLAGKEAEGFLCCYNHPYWSLQNWQDYKDLDHVFAMEIYNHGCELDGLYGYAPRPTMRCCGPAGGCSACPPTTTTTSMSRGTPGATPSAGSPCSSCPAWAMPR
ncbi:hypothetical protein [Faecalibacterium sp. An77]|uniref:PHP domain-containing protein n=1 Tax=Faecalibacterium sp. An77 TaxID=1965655 RepID=UPI0026AA492A